MQAKYNEIAFTDADVVNPDDFIPLGESNPHKVRPWLFHDHGFVIAVVFADCLQDALDIAADAGKLDRFQIDPKNPLDREDYLIKDVPTPGFYPDIPAFIDEEGGKWFWKEGYEPTYLGNAGEPFDIESLGMEELPNVPFSFVTLFNASGENEQYS